MFHIFSMQIPVHFCTVQIALCTLEVSSRQFPMHFLLDQSDLCMGDLWCLAKWISSLHRSFDIFCLAQSECYVYALSTSTLEITVGQIGFRIMLHVLQCCLPYVGLLLQYISVRVQVFRASLWWLDHCVSLLRRSLALWMPYYKFNSVKPCALFMSHCVNNSIACDLFCFLGKLDYITLNS